MRAQERFLQYIQYPTASDAQSLACPSTQGQRVLGEALVVEMLRLGIADARIDAFGYVYGSIPSNVSDAPAIGLIAHMDTVDSVPCQPMRARIVTAYDGGDIVLDAQTNEVLSPLQDTALAAYRGQDLIVTDGRTLLGADDKAGIAEILTLCEQLCDDPALPHGKICIAFTPDEEIGNGTDHFDVAGFGASFAYTVDGGELGELEYENFNAATGRVLVHGVSIHPGSAKNKMKNALLIAIAFQTMLPAHEIPACTEGYEGFYHLQSLHGNEERAEMLYILRDHDLQRFLDRKARFSKIADYLNDQYGAGTLECTVTDSYYNMKEKILPHMDIVHRAERAMTEAGVTPRVVPIRGGTDGARLSYMGLPCPNLSTGGMNYHGRHEWIPVQALDAMVRVLHALVRA
ncbi:MAG: peptidase T [Clostridia bacterium]